MPTDILALPPSSLNTKWKEPYASASLNQRFVGITAPGIYRGLRLQPDPSLGDRTIQVQSDPDKLDHVAVYENASGFSVTYRDATSGDIILSLAAYSSINVVICIFVDYQTGVSTTGAFRVFTEAEFNSLLPAISNALVILGTVTVPASGVIPTGNISLTRRTLASTNLSRGTILNSPLVRNPGFESGETNATHVKSSLFWDKSMTVGTGTWKTSTAQVSTGMKSIELNVTAGPVTGELSQQVGVETAEDELFLVSISIKQLKTISSGSLVFFMEWSDVNDALLTTTTITLNGGGVDSSFRVIETFATAPAGAASLRSVGIRATMLSPSTTGIFGYIDNVDVLVEPRDTSHPYPFDQAFRRQLAGTSLALYSKAGGFADLMTSLRFDHTTPSGEGRLLLEPGNASNLPPTFEIGRLRKLGSSLLGSEANALKPRIEADISVFAGTEFTLMWESARAGETVGFYTQPVSRMYTSATGTMFSTVNARFDGTNWNKDVSGINAIKHSLSGPSVNIYERVSDVAWADASWSPNYTVGTSPLFQQDIRHGDRTLVIPCFAFQWETTGLGATDILLDQGFIVTMKFVVLNFNIPLITGDRVKSVSVNLLGNGAADVSSVSFYIRNASGISTTIFTGAVTNPPASYATYTFDIIPDYTLQVGESICGQYVCNAAGLQIANTSVVYDHPLDT